MIRAILSAVISFLVPGFGHLFVNFQFLRGFTVIVLFIMFYMVGFVILMVSYTLGLVFNILVPLAHIYVAYVSYTDARKKFKSNKTYE
jgi:hypothetical protein